MSAHFDELVAGLKKLRGGRGIDNTDIKRRAGVALQRIAGVETKDGPEQIRLKITDQLRCLIEKLPDDLRLATRAAFGLDGALRMRLYQERLECVATKLDRHPRTVQRRINEGINRIAELAMQQADSPRAVSQRVESPWRTAELSVSVVLDLATPEVIETRRIIATRDGLTEVELDVTLTPPPGSSGSYPLDELGVDVLYGGTLTSRITKTRSSVGFTLHLPEPLLRDQEHEYGLRARLPSRHAMAPHYVCTPWYPCAAFRLHIRFGVDRVPGSVWRVEGTSPLDLADPRSTSRPVRADRCGEVHTMFSDLEPNLCYGIAWDAGEADA